MNGLREDRLRADLGELAELAVPTDLHDRVLVASRRATVRTTAMVALVLAVVGSAVGYAVWARPGGAPAPLPAGPRDPVTLPLGEIRGYSPGLGANEAGDLARATLDLPAWPGAPVCPTGTIAFFKGGTANLPDRQDVTVSIKTVVESDVDDDGATDHVAVVECTTGSLFAYQVLAFSDVDGTAHARTVGRLVSTGVGGIEGVFGLATAKNGAIQVQVGDGVAATAPSAQLQWRTYAWQGSSFAQTAGPIAFDPNPPQAALTLTATAEAPEADVVTVKATVTNSGTSASAGLYLTILVPSLLQPSGDVWAGCVKSDEGLVEGQLILQCPFDGVPVNGAIAREYTFVRTPGGTTSVPTIFVHVDQGTTRVLERNLNDNQIELPMP